MSDSTNQYAPVVLFAYKKLDALRNTLNALSGNYLAAESDLIVFSDGPKAESDLGKVSAVRDFLRTVKGFRSVEVHESDMNKGLAASIISGVSKVLESHSSVIVVEDDILTSRNFLSFMNAALEFYRHNEKVFSVSGYSVPVRSSLPYDVYFTQRSNSSCWATWKDRWETVDWEVSGYAEFITNTAEQKKFNRMGSDMSAMLRNQMEGRINSWAIRWCYHQFRQDLYSVYPLVSKAVLQEARADATHTSERFSRFGTVLDKELKTAFVFPEEVTTDPKALNGFLKPHSLRQRIIYKILNAVFR